MKKWKVQLILDNVDCPHLVYSTSHSVTMCFCKLLEELGKYAASLKKCEFEDCPIRCLTIDEKLDQK